MQKGIKLRDKIEQLKFERLNRAIIKYRGLKSNNKNLEAKIAQL
jgi:hypothetical protein